MPKQPNDKNARRQQLFKGLISFYTREAQDKKTSFFKFFASRTIFNRVFTQGITIVPILQKLK